MTTKKAELESVLEQIAAIAAQVTGGPSQDFAESSASPANGPPLTRRSNEEALTATRPRVHRLGRSSVCSTDQRGHATPGDRSPTEIVLDASEGFVPLWTQGVTLRWQFNEASLDAYLYPELLKNYIRDLMSEAILAWGDAAPVAFKERDDAWDFELVIRASDDCDVNGCALASAFFPDGGRHKLTIFPKMFNQSHKEQVDTLIHEIGHAFGLRHFFAQVSETAWPSEVFGTHSKFSIMNYGSLSQLTDEDKSDLKLLYDLAWSGNLTNVNGTPIHLMTPYHDQGTVVTPACEPVGLRKLRQTTRSD